MMAMDRSLLIVLLAVFAQGVSAESNGSDVSVKVAQFDFGHVRTPYLVALAVFVAGIARLVFHATKLSLMVPESCLLVLFGLGIGGLLSAFPDAKDHLHFTPDLFFMYLLPPIVLDAGYLMKKRHFFYNLGSILMYAVVGTLWNTFSVALGYYFLKSIGAIQVDNFGFVECMLLGTIVAAVDPVAVLSIFDEVHVNLTLYILVFGESLLNDAVSVVLYRLAETFVQMENIGVGQVFLGIVSFFTVSLGGLIIGVLWGMLASYITRFTDHVRVLETLVVFVGGYLAYLTAEVFHFSGILSAVSCGLVMRRYLNPNVSMKSRTTIKYMMKMLSSASETIIFLLLGLEAVTSDYEWDSGLVFGTLIYAFIFRFVGVFVLTWLLNKDRFAPISFVEQFVMGYGGLRGAVSFSLVLLLDKTHVPSKDAMFTATFVLIMFTVFVQGSTIKPLVERLHIRRYKPIKKPVNQQVHEKMMDHITAGIEDIVGQFGDQSFIEWYRYYDEKYLAPLLERSNRERAETIIHRMEKAFHLEAKKLHLAGGGSTLEHPVEIRKPVVVTSPTPKRSSLLPLSPKRKTEMIGVEGVRDNVSLLLVPTRHHPIRSHNRNTVSDEGEVRRLQMLRLVRKGQEFQQDDSTDDGVGRLRSHSDVSLAASEARRRRECLRRCMSEEEPAGRRSDMEMQRTSSRHPLLRSHTINVVHQETQL